MNYICESCGSDLKYYDKVSRMVRTKNRKASIITVKRFKCPVCNCIHRNPCEMTMTRWRTLNLQSLL